MVYDSEYVVLDESNAMKIVNEAYFGKTKEVLAIEQAVHDLREPYLIDRLDHNLNINTYTPKIKHDPNRMKLQQAICDAFGFEDALIEVQSTAMPNFGTYAASSCIDLGSKKLKNALKSSKSGFRYDKSAKILFNMQMNTGILLDSDITDAEITAGILHEIGHNFSPAISRGVYATSMFPAITWVSLMVAYITDRMISGIYDRGRSTIGQDISDIVYSALINTNVGHKVKSAVDYFVHDAAKTISRECPAIGVMLGGASTAVSIVIAAIQAVMSFMSSLIPIRYSWLPMNALHRILRGITRPTGYEDEKFADAFASSYGYGAELNSFLVKLREYKYSLGAIDQYMPVYSAMVAVYQLPFIAVLNALDEHPSDAARADHTIRQLKRELAEDKTLKPSTRKKIEQDIKNIENMYDYHQNVMKGLPKGSDVHKLYQQTMFKILGGDIRGKFVATHVSDDIDKAYAATRESVDVWDNKEHIGMIKENTDMMKNRFKDLMNF